MKEIIYIELPNKKDKEKYNQNDLICHLLAKFCLVDSSSNMLLERLRWIETGFADLNLRKLSNKDIIKIFNAIQKIKKKRKSKHIFEHIIRSFYTKLSFSQRKNLTYHIIKQKKVYFSMAVIFILTTALFLCFFPPLVKFLIDTIPLVIEYSSIAMATLYFGFSIPFIYKLIKHPEKWKYVITEMPTLLSNFTYAIGYIATCEPLAMAAAMTFSSTIFAAAAAIFIFTDILKLFYAHLKKTKLEYQLIELEDQIKDCNNEVGTNELMRQLDNVKLYLSNEECKIKSLPIRIAGNFLFAVAVVAIAIANPIGFLSSVLFLGTYLVSQIVTKVILGKINKNHTIPKYESTINEVDSKSTVTNVSRLQPESLTVKIFGFAKRNKLKITVLTAAIVVGSGGIFAVAAFVGIACAMTLWCTTAFVYTMVLGCGNKKSRSNSRLPGKNTGDIRESLLNRNQIKCGKGAGLNRPCDRRKIEKRENRAGFKELFTRRVDQASRRVEQVQMVPILNHNKFVSST